MEENIVFVRKSDVLEENLIKHPVFNIKLREYFTCKIGENKCRIGISNHLKDKKEYVFKRKKWVEVTRIPILKFYRKRFQLLTTLTADLKSFFNKSLILIFYTLYTWNNISIKRLFHFYNTFKPKYNTLKVFIWFYFN